MLISLIQRSLIYRYGLSATTHLSFIEVVEIYFESNTNVFLFVLFYFSLCRQMLLYTEKTIRLEITQQHISRHTHTHTLTRLCEVNGEKKYIQQNFEQIYCVLVLSSLFIFFAGKIFRTENTKQKFLLFFSRTKTKQRKIKGGQKP